MLKIGASARLLTCSLLLTDSACPWWETGHETVARIAAAHLTPANRTRVAHILDVTDTPEAVSQALAKASLWADETKAETKTGDWHFINLTLQDEKSAIPRRCPDENCVTARIRIFAGELTSHSNELEALRYLVHFVGDVHQPLHTISDADEGGNCEHLDPPVGRARNLHALWDGEIINDLNPDDKSLATDLMRDIRTQNLAHSLSGGSPDDWTWDSHELAVEDIYHKLHIPTEPVIFPANCDAAPVEIRDFKPAVDALYVDSMKPVIRMQLIKAGLRLARLLNDSL
ncbi:MAG: S1/P1 nuclease [Acidobacteriaceae bacterium]|nr:S1/P1 nuclease [Acidobacteriaceae bacterium]